MTFVGEAVNLLMSALYHLEKALVAAVNGTAEGGGIGLALVANVVIAADSARFVPKFKERLASIPDLGSTWLLPRLVGRSRSLTPRLLGDTISIKQAETMGLIWQCYPTEELMAAGAEVAHRLARGPAFAMACAKRALRELRRNDLDQQLRLEMEFSAQCGISANICEAAAASCPSEHRTL